MGEDPAAHPGVGGLDGPERVSPPDLAECPAVVGVPHDGPVSHAGQVGSGLGRAGHADRRQAFSRVGA